MAGPVVGSSAGTGGTPGGTLAREGERDGRDCPG